MGGDGGGECQQFGFSGPLSRCSLNSLSPTPTMGDSDSTRILQFINCSILRDHQIMKEDLWVGNGKIVDPEKLFFDEKKTAHEKIDCKGALISPGLIDVQINGGFGIDFSYNTEDVENGIRKVAKLLLTQGTTAFCPTIVTSPPHVYRKILPHIQRIPGGREGAAILGLHLEGPFISPEKKGAHPEQCISNFDKGFQSLLDMYGSLDNVSMLTLAPEKDNCCEVIQELVKQGVTVSLGHSVSNLQQGEEGVLAGASFITHLFNAMLPFHHRDPGLVGLLTSDVVGEDCPIYYGMICDGIHTHPAALRIAYRANPKGLVIVTDAIAAMGLADGHYQLGQLAISVVGGRAYITGTETLCGSVASMIESVKFFHQATSCSIVEALEAATLHPAKALRIENAKGTLQYGADADFILLSDPSLDLISTWIAGECVYAPEVCPGLCKSTKSSRINNKTL